MQQTSLKSGCEMSERLAMRPAVRLAMRLERALGMSVVCAGLAVVSAGSAIAQSSATPPAMARFPDFRQIVQEAKEKVFPAVVYIRCVQESNEQGKKESRQISGSGVIISPSGDVLTNWHVIDKAQNVRCLLSDGRHADAKVLGSDKDTDLAVIHLEFPASEVLPCAALGDSSLLKEGDFVMAMGAPWGLNRSVSIGIISCTRRYLDQISEYSLWLQTDAAINPGNSGGPLVNTMGEVVGINARGNSGSAEGLGFAIPSEVIRDLVPQLRDHGHVTWSWSGLQLQALRDFNRDMYFDGIEGVIVSETDPESPAKAAGFEARDRIVKIDGAPITALTEEDLPSVRRRLGLLEKGKEAVFDVSRGGKMVQVRCTPREKGKVEGEELALDRFDFTVKAINQFNNPDLYFHRKQGVYVYGVKYPGNAGNAGLTHQDIILKIDGKEVTTIDQVKELHKQLLANVETSHRVVLVIMRGGLTRQMVLDFQRDYSKE